MKKSLLSILALAVFATGCQNYDDQFDSLNKQITALTSKVDGLNPATAADVSAISGQLTSLKGLVDAMTAQNITDLAAALAKIAEVSAALEALDTKVATDIAGVETSVASVTAALGDTATSAEVASLSAVTDLQTELDAIKTALDGLLKAGASLKRDISITDSAELGLAESLIDKDNTQNYILEGNLIITATSAASYDNDLAGAITRISALTAKLATVLGTVTSTTNSSSVALDMSNLAYVKTHLGIAGKLPTLTALATTGAITIDTDDAEYNLSNLVSAGEIAIDISSVVSVTSIVIPTTTTAGAATNGAGGNQFVAVDATVNLGKAGLPATVTVADLTAGGTTYTSGTISTTGGNISLSAGTISTSTIKATGNITLSGATELDSSVITAGGDINSSQVLFDAEITMTAGGNITLAATSITGVTALTAASNVDAKTVTDQTAGLTITANSVDLTGMTSNTGALTVASATLLNLDAMTNSAGVITGAAVTTINAPLLTLTVTNSVNIAADSTHKYKSIVENFSSRTLVASDVSNLTLMNQTTPYSFDLAGEWNRLSVLDVTGATAGSATLSNAITVGSSNVSMTAITLGGNISDFTSDNSAMAALTTGGSIRNFTVSGTTLATINFGHSSVEPGAASKIDITNTALASLDMGNSMKVEYIYISDNVTLTSITMPGATLLPEPTASISITIHDNALTGAWTAAVTGTNTTPFVEGSFSTAPGISGAKTFITALSSQTGRSAGTVLYAIEVDAASAALTGNQGTSVIFGNDAGQAHFTKGGKGIIDGTEIINESQELALLSD